MSWRGFVGFRYSTNTAQRRIYRLARSRGTRTILQDVKLHISRELARAPASEATDFGERALNQNLGTPTVFMMLGICARSAPRERSSYISRRDLHAPTIAAVCGVVIVCRGKQHVGCKTHTDCRAGVSDFQLGKNIACARNRLSELFCFCATACIRTA